MRCSQVLLLLLALIPGVATKGCIRTYPGFESGCPDGWKEIMSNPQFCLKLFTHRETWYDARDKCKTHGANLTTYHYFQVGRQIENFKLDRTYFGATVYWIGLTRKDKSSHYHWLNETSQIPFESWDYSPSVDALCVAGKRFHSGWFKKSCSNVAAIFCEIRRPPSGCPNGWDPLDNTDYCLWDSRSKRKRDGNYARATQTCADLNSTVVTVRDQTKQAALLEWTKILNNVWVGYNDERREGNFEFVTGGIFRFVNTQRGVINGFTQENCLHTEQEFHTWYDGNCSLKYRYICQKTSSQGVTSPVMEMTSRYPKRTRTERPHIHYYFVGDRVRVTCKALRVNNKKLLWSILKPKSQKRIFRNIGQLYVSHYIEYVMDGNKCVDQTVSTLSIPATMDIDHTHVSCFSYGGADWQECAISMGDPMEYCKKSYIIQVNAGPEQGPEFSVEYSRPPSTMMDGEQLTAKCTVHTGDGGALVWVMYTQDGNRTLEHHFDPEIISEEFGLDSRGKVFVHSVVQFQVDLSFSGSAIACFAFDVSGKDSLECEKREKLCEVSPPITVLQQPDPEPSWYAFPRPGFFLVGGGIIVVLVCLGAPLKACGEDDWESLGEADGLAEELGTGRTGGSLVSVGEKRKSKGKDSQKSKETDNGKSKGRDSGVSGVESEVLNISASTELD